MRNIIRRSLSLLLALVMIAGLIYLPTPVETKADAATTNSAGGVGLTEYVQDGATLQCWNWSFNNIKANMGLIANLGYSSIQVSPPQEGKEGSVNKPFNNWWVLYQPISFTFNENPNNAVGTRDEFIALCNEAHKYGIRVIVDVISNHLADDGGTTINPSPLIPEDILNDRSCWHTEYNVQSSNYADRYDITQRAMKLPDLNTGNKKIQNYVLNFLKDCIDCGADGFRYDAAKQIETPDDYYTYASDFWPTVINGANDYASSTRGIMLYHYGEMLANPDESGSLPVTAYTKYMSVTENAWSNDIRHFMHYGDVNGIQTNLNKGYFKQCNADKLILWPESHDTYWDGIMNEDKSWYYGPNQAYSHEVGKDALNRTYAFLAARAYAMSLYFARPNDMLYQEMGDIAKTGWSDDSVKAVNWFKNYFAGQSEYVSTYGNFAYVERGDSGVVIVNVPGGSANASVPNHKLKAGTYKDQVTGNTFTVSADGWIYGDIGSSGVAVIYNAPTASCSHASHGSDGYCYTCYAYVGHKSGSKCSTCGTASTKTIYFENTGNWSNVYLYGWHDSSSDAVTNGWPGNKMTKNSNGYYEITVSSEVSNLIFNNGSGTQTANLTPSVEGDTYNYSTGYWKNQGEVFYADNYFLFGNINGADYNGTEYIFIDGKQTVKFNEDSYVFVLDSNGVEYFTEGWQGEVKSVTMYPGAQVTNHNRMYIPGGVTVTVTCTPNADGSITLSYEEGGDLPSGGDTGSTTTKTIYFDATGSGWTNVNVYAWTDTTPYTGVWPGSAMTKVSGNIYSYNVPTSATSIIFNNGSSQTSDLVIPTNDANLYTYSTTAWSVYDSSSSGGSTGGDNGGNTGGNTGGSTGGNVTDNLYYLFWGNSSGSLSHNEWDTPFVNGQTTVTFDETMYVWVISADGGIQYMTDGWVGNVTSAKLYPQPQLSSPNKLVVPAGTTTLYLSDNGDGSLTLSYGEGNSGNTGGSTGGDTGSTTNSDYYMVGYINGANYGCDEDWANVGQYKFVDGKLTTTFAQDSYVFIKTGDNANWYMFETYCDSTSGTLKNTNNGTSEKMLVPGGVEVTFTLVVNSDGTLTLSYTTDGSSSGGNQGGTTVPGASTTIYFKNTAGWSAPYIYAWSDSGDTTNAWPGNAMTLVSGETDVYSYTLNGYAANVIFTNNGSSQTADIIIPTDGKNMYTYSTSGWSTYTPSGNQGGTTTESSYKLVTSMDELNAGGDFLIVAQDGSSYYVMTLTYSGTTFESAAITVTDNKITGSDLPAFTLTPVDGGFSASVGTTTLDYTLVATQTANGFQVTLLEVPSFGLLFKKSTSQFRFTGVSNANNSDFIQDLLLFKYDDGTTTECSHSYSSKVTTAATCDKAGVKTFTCSKCGDSYTETIAATGHSYSNGSCSACGAADPNYEKPDVPTTTDYYLFGWINNANYGCEEDWENLGEYKFVNGKLTTTFAEDSYVAVKTADNVNWYMTDGWAGQVTSATLYDSNTLGENADKLFVPGGVTVTFTLVANEDGTLTLSYTTGSVTVPTLTLNYPSLSFEDEILYNVYYGIDDTSSVVEMGLVTFSSKLASGTIANAVDVFPGYVNSGSTYMAQTDGIPAKNLGDALYFKVYAKLTDGSYVYSDIAGYHAVAYANTVLNNASSSAKAKALVVAMLNYGAAAQTYFGYKTSSLMNANLTSAQKALVSSYSSSMVADVVKADSSKVGSFVMNGGYSNIWPTVSFEGAFSINFYFTPNKTVDSAPTFYYWDAETYNSVSKLTAQNATGVITMAQDGSNWGAAVEGIAAKDMDSTIYVAGIYTSNGVSYPTSVISYSLGNYCKTVAANGEAFGAATAVYGYYAKAYFA